MTTISEDFTALSTASNITGGSLTWTESGDWRLISGAGSTVVAGNPFAATANVRAESDLATVDHYCQIVLNNPDGVSTTYQGACVRYDSSAQTFYAGFVRDNTTGSYEIGKVVAGSYTSLASDNDAGINLLPGDVVRFEVSGTSLTLKVNGVTVLSATNGDITTGTRCGMRAVSGTAAEIRSFEAGDLPAGAVPIIMQQL